MKPKNFDKTCRVCLDVSEFVTPIFGTVFKSDLPDKIAYCTGLKIENGDGNLCQICQCCLDNLHISYVFKKTCVENNNYVLKHFYGIKRDARVKLERIVIDDEHKQIKTKEIDEKFDCDIKIESTSPVKTQIDLELYDEAIEKLNDGDIHTYDDDTLNITDNDSGDKNDNQLPNNDVNQNKDNAESIIILVQDDNDDFYWPEDEDINQIKAKETTPKVSQVKKNKATVKKRGKCDSETRKKWQRLDEYGNPKKSKQQLLKEAAAARRQELAKIRAAKPPPEPKPQRSKVRILPDGVLPKAKKKRVRNKPPKKRCCVACDIVFPTREERDAHVHAVHGGFTTTIICEVCGKVFSGASSFSYHYASHYPPQYSCRLPGCHFKAYVSTALRNHMRLHEEGEEALFSCRHCEAKFKTVGARGSHEQRRHRARRRHACARCGQDYSEKSKLRLHEMTHTGKRPHACAHCSAAFTRRDQLRLHARRQHGVLAPRAAPGRHKRNRVVDIYRLKDAGRMIQLNNTDISDVGAAHQEVAGSSENKGEKSDNLGIKSNDFDNVDGNYRGKGKNSENVGRKSEHLDGKSENVTEFTVNNIMQEGSGCEITIGDWC